MVTKTMCPHYMDSSFGNIQIPIYSILYTIICTIVSIINNYNNNNENCSGNM